MLNVFRISLALIVALAIGQEDERPRSLKAWASRVQSEVLAQDFRLARDFGAESFVEYERRDPPPASDASFTAINKRSRRVVFAKFADDAGHPFKCSLSVERAAQDPNESVIVLGHLTLVSKPLRVYEQSWAGSVWPRLARPRGGLGDRSARGTASPSGTSSKELKAAFETVRVRLRTTGTLATKALSAKRLSVTGTMANFTIAGFDVKSSRVTKRNILGELKTVGWITTGIGMPRLYMIRLTDVDKP